ncbi:MAG: hypothetical protein WC541_10235 [Dehalococcoidia bacterium]
MKEATVEQLVLDELSEAMLRAAERLNKDLTAEQLLGIPMALFRAENVMRAAFIKWVHEEDEK